jgi:hypothetical protein
MSTALRRNGNRYASEAFYRSRNLPQGLKHATSRRSAQLKACLGCRSPLVSDDSRPQRSRRPTVCVGGVLLAHLIGPTAKLRAVVVLPWLYCVWARAIHLVIYRRTQLLFSGISCVYPYENRAAANTLVQHHTKTDTSSTDHEFSPRNHAYTTASLQPCLRDLRANHTRKETHSPNTTNSIFKEILIPLSEKQCLHKHNKHHPINLIQEVPTPQISPSLAVETQLKELWNRHRRHECPWSRFGDCSDSFCSEGSESE